MVIWVTGLSGSGKTTLCTALAALLRPRMPGLAVLDGDVIRAVFGHDLDHTEPSRVRQIKRLQGLAAALSGQGLIVIVGALYAHPELLAWNREHLSPYFEVYLKAPLDLVRARDQKGLYDGRTRSVVGVDIPWHEPERPDLVIDAAKAEPPPALARRVLAAIPGLRPALVEGAP